MKVKTKTDSEVYAGRRNWYIAGFGISLLTLIISSLMALKHTMFGWEVSIFDWINGWPTGLQTFFRIASVAKEGPVIAVIAVIIAFILRHWRLAWRLAVSTIGGAALAFLLKHFIDRARPQGLIDHVNLRWTDTGAGFPSGHVAIMTVVMLTIMPYLPSRWRWTVPTGIALVCLSRMYLGLHAPLDIIGGLAVGVLVVTTVRIMPQALRVFFRLD